MASGMKAETEKAKAQSGGTASPGIDPKLREAALVGSGADTASWREQGARYLYKAEHFATLRDGVLVCWRLGPDGKQIPTAPEVVGIPYGVVARDSDKYGEYDQIAIELTKDTFVMVGEGAAKYEQAVLKGQTILITATAALEDVVKFANDPHIGTEVALRPLQKRSIGGGKDIWDWSIKANQKKFEKVALVQGELPPSLQA